MDERSIGNDVTMRGAGGAQPLGCIDQYELVRELGGGGFGTVFLARDTVAGIEVAVKGLPPLVRNNREELENIRKNFALVSRLHHPYIAAALVLHPVRSAAYAERAVAEKLRVFEGDTLMVMEYAPGVTLSQWRRQFPDGKVPVAETLEIVRQIADALDYAHAAKIIHRDVKPSNVMVETRDRVKGTGEGEGLGLVVRVLDFGLAAEVRSSMGRVSREITDTSGTRPYMAPEQWLGKKQNAATDQYALAVLAYELLTGEVPFASVFETGDPVVMMNVVGREMPEIAKSLPRAMRAAFEKAFAKEPDRRFASCADFAAALAGRRAGSGGAGGVVKSVLIAGLALALGAAGYFGWQQFCREKGFESLARPMASKVSSVTPSGDPNPSKTEDKPAAKPVEPVSPPVPVRPSDAELESRAEMSVFDLAASAEAAKGMIDREDEAFKTFFASEIRAFDRKRSAGDDAKRSGRYVVATNLLAEALSLADALRAAKGERQRCREALDAAERARSAAEAVGSATEAKSAYDDACADMKSAAERLAAKDFVRALALAQGATERLNSVRMRIVSGALSVAKHHREAERWEACRAAAEKVLGWEPGNAEAKRLQDEAGAHLVPSLRLVTKIGSREVSGAETEIASQSHYSPLSWDKLEANASVGGFKFTYTEHGRKYVGKAPRWTVDWRGPKTMTVMLEEFKEPSAGDTKTVTLPGGAKLELVWCPPGEFTMGSDDGGIDEKPKHTVRLTKGFWIGKYEVTQGQWKSVMGNNPSNFTGDDKLPVECVSWEDCTNFCHKAGLGLRLPTEVEWEYACRAGSITAYCWGNALNGDRANCNGEVPHGTTIKGRYLKKTTAVGSYPKGKNVWGIYDMHGNVLEWCADWYDADYYLKSPIVNPPGPTSGVSRVVRGGCFVYLARHCRSASRFQRSPANRGKHLPGDRSDNFGFRVCCSAGPYE